MAGIFDRIKPNVSESTERIPVQLISSAVVLYATGTYTRGQILAAINDYLTVNLTAQEQLDLGQWADEVDAITGADPKQTYALKLNAALIAAEFGMISENQLRSVTGI